MSQFGACSARINGDTHTDTQNDYRNPRCACAPRVNERSLNIASHGCIPMVKRVCNLKIADTQHIVSTDTSHRMSFLWQQRTQREKEQKKNLEDVNQLLLESILPTKVSKYYMEEDRNAVSSL